MKISILTERLAIRPLICSDLNDLLAITGSHETYRYIPEEPMNEAAVRRMIERGQNNLNVDNTPPDMAVIHKGTKELVGLLSFININIRFRVVEIGWMFNQDHRGRGYASEAAQALVNYGFSTLGLHRIIATCDPRNLPSVRIMEKLGMRREAEFLNSVLLGDGEWHNEYFYAITEREWDYQKQAG